MALLYLKWLMVFMISSAVVSGAAPYRRWCYYTNWAQYRNSPGRFTPSNIDPFLCTHISYAFATIKNGKATYFEWNDESTAWSKGMYEQTIDMKKKNSMLQIYLAIGGWNLGSAPFTQVVDNAVSRSRFIDSAISLVRRNKFDGIELDWEYPAGRGSPPEDKRKFTLLVQELRMAVELEASSTNRPRLGLAAAVSAGKSKIDVGYEIPEISKALDIINLMTYDFHGSWDVTTGANSPLRPRGDEKGEFLFWNLESASLYWLQKGTPKEKLNIGVPTYGRSFTLTDAKHNGMGAPVIGPGDAGPSTRSKGFLAYYEICDLLKNGATEKWDDVQKVPYLFKDRFWVSYDNIRSLNLKVQWIMKMGFGGVMVWSLPLDDHAGLCGSGPYPLIKSIYRTLSGGNPMVTVHPQSTPSPQGTLCSGRKDGFYPIPGQCRKFIYCKSGQDTILPCSAGQAFDPVSKLCTMDVIHLCDVTTAATITTEQPRHEANVCLGKSDGFYPDPSDCHAYHICRSGMDFKQQCSSKQVFKGHNCVNSNESC